MKIPKAYVHIKQLTFMQRLADRAKTGFFEYISGRCKSERYPSLAQKFRRLYETDLSKDQRYRRRKDGSAVYDLIAYQSNADPSADVVWILLKTSGKPSIAADQGETWTDMRSHRLGVFQRFELHMHTRKDMSKPSWSWRVTKELYASWRERVIHHVRRREDRHLAELLADAHTSPKFAPIRQQLFALQALVEAEFKRSRSSQDSPPVMPRVGYTRRVKDRTRAVS